MPVSGSRRARMIALSVVASFGAATGFAQSALPPELASGSRSTLPVTVQLLRWHMLDAEINSLTFRSMDSLFTTREVARSGPVRDLPRADHPLDFTYSYKDQMFTPDQF